MIESISLILAIVGIAIAIYQAAIIKERKSGGQELQYLQISVAQSASSKAQGWETQINIKLQERNREGENLTRDDQERLAMAAKARDEFNELYLLAKTMEGVIDPDSSAASGVLKKLV